MNLWQDFLINGGRPIHKWVHYFPIYERHFEAWRNRTLTFLEIGVGKGGSLPMWRRYFGPLATVVGIDIDPACKAMEEEGIHIRIGDQSDHAFLDSLVQEFGEFDIILDDGSHQMEHIRRSFEHLYPRISKNGIYMIEDLHTAYWEEYGGGTQRTDSFINLCKSLIDDLNAAHSRGAVEPSFITTHTFGMHFYDSVVVFERGSVPTRCAPVTGAGTLSARLSKLIRG